MENRDFRAGPAQRGKNTHFPPLGAEVFSSDFLPLPREGRICSVPGGENGYSRPVRLNIHNSRIHLNRFERVHVRPLYAVMYYSHIFLEPLCIFPHYSMNSRNMIVIQYDKQWRNAKERALLQENIKKSMWKDLLNS